MPEAINKLPEISQGLSAFNEDPINSETIGKKPMLITPPLPGMSASLANYLKVMNNNSSNLPTNSISTESITAFASQRSNPVLDPFKDSKQMYGDFQNPNSNTFYDRYKAHGNFDKLGFSPFRDNETLYNQHSGFWDEMGRAAGQWGTLSKLGFIDETGFGNLSDQVMAEKYKIANKIGSSSKGGFTGFTTNLFLNSGYSVGIMAELVAEEAAMLAAEAGLTLAIAPSGGTSAIGMGLVGARMASKAAKTFDKLYDVYKGVNKLGKVLDDFKDVSKAREYFTKAASATGNFLNPLENTTDFIKNYGKLDNLGNYQKTFKGFASFYRDVRNVRLAYGEGSLEGGMVQNEMERSLYSDFVTSKGRQPDAKESELIRSTAEQAGKITSITNAPMIMLSNKLTLDGLGTGKFRALTSDVFEVSAGKVIFNPKKGVTDPYSAVSKNFFKAKWNYIKNPKLIAGGMGTYGKANLMEGVQELSQNVIADTNKDYYTAKFNGDATRGGYLNYVAEAIKGQMSKEGVETFASGFLMGGMMAPVSQTLGVITQGKEGFRDTLAGDVGGFVRDKFATIALKNNPEELEAYTLKEKNIKDQRQKKLDDDVKLLNDYYNNSNDYLSKDIMNLMEQSELGKAMEIAKQNGDPKTYYDMKDSAAIQHTLTALQYGRMGSTIERMEDLKNLSDEDIAQDETLNEQFRKDPSSYRQVLDISIARAKKIESRWNTAQQKFPNPFTPNKYKFNSPEYSQERLGKDSWDQAVSDLVFKQQSFEESLRRTSSILKHFQNNTDLKNASYSDLSILFNIKDSTAELQLLNKEIKALEEGSLPETKKLLNEKIKKRDRLKTFTESMDTAMGNSIDETFTDEDHNTVKKAYEEYLKHIAKTSNDYYHKDTIDNSFKDLLDFYALTKRTSKLNDSINVLLNPKKFIARADRHKETMQHVLNNKENEIRESLIQFRKLKDDNDLLNKLYDIDVMVDPAIKDLLNALYNAGEFFDPSELHALKEEGLMPVKFYTLDSNNEWDNEIPMNSATYKKAVGIFQAHIKDLTGIEIYEEMEDPYYGSTRRKDTDDKRKYNELAAQYKFEQGAEESIVPLKVVLQSIIDSQHSSIRDRALAKQLLSIATENESIIFTSTGKVNAKYSETRQTVVDARYSAYDYKEGRNGHPIEYSILREEIKRRTIAGLKTDETFKNNMTQLYDEAKKAFDELSAVEQMTIIGDESQMRGLSSLEEFVAEAMSDETFQKFLGKVKTTQEVIKPIWKEFVDLVLDNLKNLFGVNINGTVLNSALSIISAKIDSEFGISTETTETTPTLTVVPNVQAEVFGDIIPNENTINNIEWDIFKKEGRVSKERIAQIAYKRIAESDSSLTEREKAINEHSKIGLKIQEIVDKHENAKKKEVYRKNLNDLINSAKNKQDIDLIEAKLKTDILDNPDMLTIGRITPQEIEDLIAKKLQELAFSFTFDDIILNEWVALNDAPLTIVQVTEITKDGIFVQPMEGDYKPIFIKKEDVKEKIKYKYSKTMKLNQEQESQVTEEDEKISQESLEQDPNANTQKQTEAAFERAATSNKQSIIDKLKNSSKC